MADLSSEEAAPYRARPVYRPYRKRRSAAAFLSAGVVRLPGLIAGIVGETLLFGLFNNLTADVLVAAILTLMPVPLVLSFAIDRTGRTRHL